jgi:ubiquitin
MQKIEIEIENITKKLVHELKTLKFVGNRMKIQYHSTVEGQ